MAATLKCLDERVLVLGQYAGEDAKFFGADNAGSGAVVQLGPVIPTASATTRAVTGASPVTITVRTPRPCNWAMSAAESSRGGSLSAITPAMRSGSAGPIATTRTRKPLV